ncbi:MAG: hypothetical protein J6A45_03010 [Lachnospiraceae bacterium]|nr:hypothetical protein [Lachnospiraceae bacterium]
MHTETPNVPDLQVKFDYKSRIFIMLFSNKERLLKLYNAMSRKNYTDPELLTINTLENAIYMSMQNDLSFLIDLRLSLYEHQSTYNPNMPLRFLLYLSDLYSKLTKNMNLYGSKKLEIPPPRFVVFYNGREKRPDYEEFRLSDLYTIHDETVSLELIVEVFNINKGHNTELVETCRDLQDYVEYTHRVRTYAEELPIEEAVEKAINECIQEGILKDFLEANRAEAMKVSIYEYNEQEHMRMEREDAFEDGRKLGFEEGCSLLLTLMAKMTADGLNAELSRLSSDPEFYQEMMRKYLS